MKKLLVSIMILFFSFSVLKADVTLKAYQGFKKNGNKQLLDDMKSHIGSLGQGIFWANIFLNSQQSKELYCQPNQLALNSSNYQDILDAEIKESNYEEDTPLALILIIGLRKTFPCTK